jgi:hypothetical protein
MNQLLTLTDAGLLVNREASGLRKAILAGDLKAEKFGKTWVVRESDLRKWDKENPKSTAGRKKTTRSK